MPSLQFDSFLHLCDLYGTDTETALCQWSATEGLRGVGWKGCAERVRWPLGLSLVLCN